MCGIFGLRRPPGQQIREQTLWTAIRQLSHRGPDRSSIYLSSGKSEVGLAHARLSILDLSDKGTQPLQCKSSGRQIVFNGEIFNFLELRSELKEFGHSFETDTDTEVILAAYAQWGTDCLKRFNGMWAFAIWDPASELLWIARDRFGIKPLYYRFVPNKLFAFSSETRALHSVDDAPRPSTHNLARALRSSFSLEPAGLTIYEDIFALPSGFHATVDSGLRLRKVRWWTHTESHNFDHDCSIDEASSKLFELLSDSVRIRLRSDAQIATALSGGIDSAVISALCTLTDKFAAEKLTRTFAPRTAYTLSFPGLPEDEHESASLTAKHLGLQLRTVTPDWRTYTEQIVDITRQHDFIYQTPPIVHLIYRQASQDGIKVTMDGHGGDELFFGYPDMTPDAAAPSSARKNIRRSSMRILANMEPGLVRKWRQQRVHQRLLQSKSPPWLMFPHPAPPEIDTPHPTSDERITQFSEIYQYRLPTLLRNWDHASMLSGVEIRMPLLDWRVVTLATSIPIRHMVHRGITKFVLRHATASKLPPHIISQTRKIGVNAPTAYLFSNHLRELVMDITNSSSFLQSSIWNGSAIHDFVRTNYASRSWTEESARRVWPFLNAHLLLN